MRLIALVSVALSGTWVAHGLTVMGEYEIRPAGDGSSSPFGKVLTVEPFVVETYYEAASTVPSIVTYELFANAADGKPCSTGTAISNSTFNVSTSLGPKYTKTGSNSKIFAAQYSIPDVTKIPAYDNGKVDLCARTGIKKEIDSNSGGLEYVSYVDTLLVLNVDLNAKFSNFTQTVSINATAMGDLMENVTKSVAVEAAVCARDNSAASSYKIGQDFSICVSVTAEYYSITKFTNVTCENSASSRKLVVNSKPDALTTTKLNPLGYTNTSGGVIGGKFGVFSSVVTAGYFGGGETSFSCSGEVALGYNPPCQKLGIPLLTSRLLNSTGNEYGYVGLPICIRGTTRDPSLATELITTGYNGITYKKIKGFTKNSVLYEAKNESVTFLSPFPTKCTISDLFLQPSREPNSTDYSANKDDPMKLYLLYPDEGISYHKNFMQKYDYKLGPDNNFLYGNLTYNWYCPDNDKIPSSIKGELAVTCLDRVLGAGRRLLESVGFSGLFQGSNQHRNLQESEQGSFSATVGLSDNGLDSLSAPAMTLRSGVATSIAFGTGVLSLFLAAM